MKPLVLAAALTLAPSLAEAEIVTIRSAAGATARVAASAASKFQAYIRSLEQAGAKILFLGGVRSGSCSIPRSKHPCGLALDVCQTARGRVDARCRLPARQEVVKLAAAHGLIEGGAWCHHDYGHVEVRTARQGEACKHHPFLGKAKSLEDIKHTSLPSREAWQP